MDNKERCKDCICLIEKDGRMYCDEVRDFCVDIDNCPEFQEKNK